MKKKVILFKDGIPELIDTLEKMYEATGLPRKLKHEAPVITFVNGIEYIYFRNTVYETKQGFIVDIPELKRNLLLVGKPTYIQNVNTESYGKI